MNRDDMISVTLTAGQWETVMVLLSEQPYKLSAPFVQSIQTQCVQFELKRVQQGHQASVSDEDQR